MKASEYLLGILDTFNKTQEDFKYGGFNLEGIARDIRFKNISNYFTDDFNKLLDKLNFDLYLDPYQDEYFHSTIVFKDASWLTIGPDDADFVTFEYHKLPSEEYLKEEYS